MRIIAGQFKGRRLVDFKADHVRPTTDRMKETIFNILMHNMDGVRVLDLFSGTGNLAIESLSRGAHSVECVEMNKTSLKIIRENLNLLKISKEIRIVPRDVFKYLKSYKGEPFQVIFADPPYTEKLSHDCLSAIKASSVLQSGTIVVMESAAKDKMEDNYEPLYMTDHRDFGDKCVRFYETRLS